MHAEIEVVYARKHPIMAAKCPRNVLANVANVLQNAAKTRDWLANLAALALVLDIPLLQPSALFQCWGRFFSRRNAGVFKPSGFKSTAVTFCLILEGTSLNFGAFACHRLSALCLGQGPAPSPASQHAGMHTHTPGEGPCFFQARQHCWHTHLLLLQTLTAELEVAKATLAEADAAIAELKVTSSYMPTSK